MKKSRFTEEQIAYALRLGDSGTAVVDVRRQIGISEGAYYTYRLYRLEGLQLRMKVKRRKRIALLRGNPKERPISSSEASGFRGSVI